MNKKFVLYLDAKGEGWGGGCMLENSRKGLNFAAPHKTLNTQSNQRINVFYFCSPKRYRKKINRQKGTCVSEEQLFFTGEQRDAD
jgi:hypothetical protein